MFWSPRRVTTSGIPSEATGVATPTTVLTFRSEGAELLALRTAGHPFYQPPWSPTIMGVVSRRMTPTGPRWSEPVIESYRFCAPQKLVRLLDA